MATSDDAHEINTVSGTFFDACDCEVVCACWAGVNIGIEGCYGLFVWRVEGGTGNEGKAAKGAKVAIVAKGKTCDAATQALVCIDVPDTEPEENRAALRDKIIDWISPTIKLAESDDPFDDREAASGAWSEVVRAVGAHEWTYIDADIEIALDDKAGREEKQVNISVKSKPGANGYRVDSAAFCEFHTEEPKTKDKKAPLHDRLGEHEYGLTSTSDRGFLRRITGLAFRQDRAEMGLGKVYTNPVDGCGLRVQGARAGKAAKDGVKGEAGFSFHYEGKQVSAAFGKFTYQVAAAAKAPDEEQAKASGQQKKAA